FYGKTFGVNIDWLKTGKGQPYKNINSKQDEIISEELIDIKPNNIDQKLLEKILTKLLNFYTNDLSGKKIQLISKEASKIYVIASHKQLNQKERNNIIESEIMKRKKQSSKY